MRSRLVSYSSRLGGFFVALSLVSGSLLIHAGDQPTQSKTEDTKDLGVRAQPLPPAESTAQIQLEPGYHLQLIANEPEVISPVDAAFDDRGRLWVVEMIDYPFVAPNQTELRGRVRILEDVDGDGRFEKATVFADKLNMPTGIALWRDGALITLAGQLEWMRDTDHNDQVDERQVWLEGFAQQNEQLRANHPRVELDGRIYVASGLRGGKIQVGAALRGRTAAEPFDLGSRDVRLDPRTGRAEAITGPAQFGMTSDITGLRMFCSNRNPCTQVVFEQSLLSDNPLAGIVPAIQDVMPAGEASRVRPLVDAWVTSNLHAGQFTAACGVHFQHMPTTSSMSDEQIKRIHRETLGNVFVCEPTGSLVKMQRVSHQGSVWTVDSQSSTNDSAEWLASRDSWFRPVNVLAAPGGGVLVIDMHRAVIEHPEWVPDELKKRPDGRFGDQAGRIYWVAPQQKLWPQQLLAELKAKPLGERTAQQLVDLLRSDDAWLRRQAARLLIERDQVEAVPELVKLVAKDGDSSVETQVLAWQLLSLFDPAARMRLKPELTDEHRLVQVTALRLIARLAASGTAQVTDQNSKESLRMEASQNSSATATALQLALTTADAWLRLEAIMSAAKSMESLTEEQAISASEGVGKLAGLNAADPYLLVASAGLARKHTAHFLMNWLDGLGQLKATDDAGKVGVSAAKDKWITAAARQLTNQAQKQSPGALPDVVARVRYLITTDEPVSALSKFAALTVLSQHAKALVAEHKSQKPVAGVEPTDALSSIDRPLWRKVRELARLDTSDPTVRMAAVELLSLSQRKGDRTLLTKLANEVSEGPLRNASIRAWCEQGSPEAEEFLITQVGSAGPGLRPIVIEQLLARPQRQVALLAKIDSGVLTAKQLGAVELKRFVDRSTGEAKAGFQKQLDSILNSNRGDVLKNYQSSLQLVGDTGRGKQVFSKQCAACHRIGDVGVQVGPDISDSRVQTADKLLTNILDPNRAIDNNYFRFVVLTNDGRTIDGLITEETSDKLVIRSQNDQRHVIARDDVQELKPTGVSMMPEGLESQIDAQAMSDLIAFIKNWRYTPGQIPSTVKAGN